MKFLHFIPCFKSSPAILFPSSFLLKMCLAFFLSGFISHPSHPSIQVLGATLASLVCLACLGAA